MNQREALLILFEATADLPETRELRRARKVMEKRIEVLRIRYARRRCAIMLGRFQDHLTAGCQQCLTRNRCPEGQELLDAGLLAGDEAMGHSPGTLSADVPPDDCRLAGAYDLPRNG